MCECLHVWKDIGVEREDYLSFVATQTWKDSLPPVGNIASCVPNLTKKTVKTAPLSILFTSLDWEGYLQGQGDMNNAHHLHLFPLDAVA